MLTVVTGGSGSGKSAFAEDLVLTNENKKRLYIATMEVYDDESRAKVERHRRLRAGKGFETLEIPVDLEKTDVPEECIALLEDMSNLVANEMFSKNGSAEDCVERILRGIENISQRGHLVIVTNSVFSDGMHYDEVTEKYLENLARINNASAAMADEVYEVVYGIPIRIV